MSALAVLNTDTVQGQHLVRIKRDEVTGQLLTNTSATISFSMIPNILPKDENGVQVIGLKGSDGNVYPMVATADGEILVDIA